MAEKPSLRFRFGISSHGDEGWSIFLELDNMYCQNPHFSVMGTIPLIRWGWISEQIIRSALDFQGDESPEEAEYYLNQLSEGTEVERKMQSAINSTWIILREIANSFPDRSILPTFNQAHQKMGELMMRIEKAHEPINRAWPAWEEFLQNNPDYNQGDYLTWEEFQDSCPE
jgi:hypothetical protein